MTTGTWRIPQRMNNEALTGKSALITGAGRGIGRAIALALAGEGMDIAVTARSRVELESLAAEVERRRGNGACHVFPADLADRDTVERLVARTRAAFHGPPDVLVNNAGVFLERPLEETEPEEWDRLFAVNLTAPYLLCRAFVPGMKARRSGRVVNIASTSGLQGYLEQAAYCASKHGLIGLSRALAVECRPFNVRVHVICPGGVRTGFIAGSKVARRIEGQAVLDPENVADLVLFVLRQPQNVDYPEVVVKRFQG